MLFAFLLFSSYPAPSAGVGFPEHSSDRDLSSVTYTDA